MLGAMMMIPEPWEWADLSRKDEKRFHQGLQPFETVDGLAGVKEPSSGRVNNGFIGGILQ